MDNTVRRFVELTLKLDSLKGEFEAWREQSTSPNPLAKHHSQIRRVTWQLEGCREEIEKSLAPLRDDPAGALDLGRRVEKQILEVHRIWEFFRSKLTLRSIGWFKQFLDAADDFAWECYRPARESVPAEHVKPEEIKAPPLTFLNGGVSPFALTRKLAFYAETVLRGEKIETFIEVLRQLPVPVIGLPWYQVQHLPEAVALGHEVGHVVYDDFRLSEEVGGALERGMEGGRVGPERREAWREWQEEIFCDLYGVLACGPAFVGALIDYVESHTDIAGERRQAGDWGGYPTAYLRVALCLEALTRRGFADTSQTLRADWTLAHPAHTLAQFEPDVSCVVEALLDGPYAALGGASLPAVLKFDTDNQENAETDVDRMLVDGLSPQARVVRELYAAARLAFVRDPAAYEKLGVQGKILSRIGAIREEGERADDAQELKPEELDKHDKAAGGRLLAAFGAQL